jgi:hypothetical protein
MEGVLEILELWKSGGLLILPVQLISRIGTYKSDAENNLE